jgi:hypothetical protein
MKEHLATFLYLPRANRWLERRLCGLTALELQCLLKVPGQILLEALTGTLGLFLSLSNTDPNHGSSFMERPYRNRQVRHQRNTGRGEGGKVKET